MSSRSSIAGFVLASITVLAVTTLGRSSVAAEIKLLASPGVRAAVNILLPEFEVRSGHKVTADFAVIAVLKRRIDAGEDFDVVIPSPAVIDHLIKEAKVSAETRMAFARSGLGVAVAKGVSKPDISSVENFKRALQNAKWIAHSKEGASGTNFLEVLDRLGIAEEIRPKLRPGGSIESGEADMAISDMGPAMEMRGAEYVGGLPVEIQRYVTFEAGINTTTKYPEATRALLRFLTSSTAAAAFKAKGLEQGVN